MPLIQCLQMTNQMVSVFLLRAQDRRAAFVALSRSLGSVGQGPTYCRSAKSDIFLATDLHQPCRAGVENCCRFLILYTQFLSFGEKFGKQLPELLSKGQELCVQNRSRTNSSPRPPFCRHAMHSYSTAYVKFLRSARARGLLYGKKFYSTVDLL